MYLSRTANELAVSLRTVAVHLCLLLAAFKLFEKQADAEKTCAKPAGPLNPGIY